ncbi:MAG: hypothetical protein MUE58_00995 [Chitinophagaceae bacterium]|jgi:hypothetical protein|nr:hypothetical protein [Chitinophagaceae bacterium]
MQRGFRIFSIILAIVLAIYFSWSKTGRKSPSLDVQPHIDSLYVLNADAGKGNIVGINPFMVPQDYASAGHFQAKLESYLQAAQLEGWLTPRTVVLFPEYIGTWLVAAGEKSSIYQANSVSAAMTTMVGSNIFSFLRNWFMAPDEAEDKVRHSVFASKAENMARIYQDVFGKLASKYKVTIVGGSILLQNPVVSRNRIRIKNGPIYNVSAVFNPDGSMQPELAMKSFPIDDEKPFMVSKPVEAIPAFNLPVGKTSVVICADAWYPETYKAIQRNQSAIILVPSYTLSDKSMDKPWGGYSGHARPPDVDSLDIGKISLREAWVKYTLPGRIKSSGAQYGMNVTLRGKLWDLGSDGEFIAVTPDSVYTGQKVEGGSMVCLYIR